MLLLTRGRVMTGMHAYVMHETWKVHRVVHLEKRDDLRQSRFANDEILSRKNDVAIILLCAAQTLHVLQHCSGIDAVSREFLINIKICC